MIHYRDRTFCNAKCANTHCDRYFSEHHKEESKKIGLPVAKCDFSDDCAYYEKRIDNANR